MPAQRVDLPDAFSLHAARGIWGIVETTLAGAGGLWLPSLDALRRYDITPGDGPALLGAPTVHDSAALWGSAISSPVGASFDTSGDARLAYRNDELPLDEVAAGSDTAADIDARWYSGRADTQATVDGLAARLYQAQCAFTRSPSGAGIFAVGLSSATSLRFRATSTEGPRAVDPVPSQDPFAVAPFSPAMDFIAAAYLAAGGVVGLKALGNSQPTSVSSGIPGFVARDDCTVHVAALDDSGRWGVLVVNGIDTTLGALEMWLNTFSGVTSEGSVDDAVWGAWQRLTVDADWTAGHSVASRLQEGRAWSHRQRDVEPDAPTGSMWLAVERGTTGGDREGLLYHIPDPIRPSGRLVAPVTAAPFEALDVSWSYTHGSAGGAQASWALGREYAGTHQWWDVAASAWQTDRVHNIGAASSIRFQAAQWYDTLPAADRDRTWRYVVQLTDTAGHRSPLSTARNVTGRAMQPVTITAPAAGAALEPIFDVTWTADSQVQATVRVYDAVSAGNLVASVSVLGETRTARVTLLSAPDGDYWIAVSVTDTVGGVSTSPRVMVAVANLPPRRRR